MEEVLCAKLQGQGEVEEGEGKEQEGGKQSKERKTEQGWRAQM